MNVKETLEILEQNKKEIEEQIQLIRGFSGMPTSEFTEEVYHKICKTPLRDASVVAEKVTAVFPFISFSSDGDNNTVYKFNDIEDNEFYNICVVIPTRTEKRIRIEIVQKKFCYYSTADIERAKKQIKELKTILHSPFQRFKAQIKYRKGKGYKDSVEDIIKLTEISILRIKKEILEYENIKKKYEEIENEIVNKYVPLFLEWTSEVVIKNGAYNEHKFTK